jgi:hypothetical protein
MALLADPVMSVMLSDLAVAAIQVAFLAVSFYFIVIPFADTLRQPSSSHYELLLSAPIKPSDLLLGEYLGELPFYAIFIAVFSGVFAAAMKPLGLGAVQVLIVTIVFILTSMSAFWIGVVGSAMLKARLERFAGGKDIGKAIAMIMPLPMVAIIYASMGGDLLRFIANPQNSIVRRILELLPSSWGAGVVVDFTTSPGNIAPVALDVAIRLGALAAFFLASLWLGARLADRAYTLEQGSLSISRAGPDGLLYAAIRALGGGRHFGSLLASLFKDYGRRLENISNLTYMLGILVIASMFLPSRGGPPVFLMSALFVYPVVVVMVNGYVTMQGKENLFIYKKAPSGISRFLRATIFKGLLLLIPLTGGTTLAMTLLNSSLPAQTALVWTGLIALMVSGDVILVIGLFLINPAFSQKSPRFMLNLFTVIGIQLAMFVVSFLLLMVDGKAPDPIESIPQFLVCLSLLVWPVGIGVMLLGRRKLNGLE